MEGAPGSVRRRNRRGANTTSRRLVFRICHNGVNESDLPGTLCRWIYKQAVVVLWDRHVPFVAAAAPLFPAKTTRSHDVSEAEAMFKQVMEKLPRNGIFVDLGANVGNIVARALDYGHKVYAFEPDPGALAVLQARFGTDPRVEIIPKAVGSVARTARFFRHRRAIPSIPPCYATTSRRRGRSRGRSHLPCGFSERTERSCNRPEDGHRGRRNRVLGSNSQLRFTAVDWAHPRRAARPFLR